MSYQLHLDLSMVWQQMSNRKKDETLCMKLAGYPVQHTCTSIAWIEKMCQLNDFKVEIFLEQREVVFLSPSKICKNLNF